MLPFPPRQRLNSKNEAFSLIELLITVAVIAVLVGILVPSFNLLRSSAKKTDCMNRQRNTGIAMLRYTMDNKGFFPFYSNGNASGSEMKMWYNIISDDWIRANAVTNVANMNSFDSNLLRNFFCSEDPNQRPSFSQFNTMQTNHYISIGYNLMGLGERKYLSTGAIAPNGSSGPFFNRDLSPWDANNPTDMARLPNIMNPSQKIMIGDSWRNAWPGTNTQKYGHAQLGWVIGMTGNFYPRHSAGMMGNITCVDGRVISIKSTKPYDDVTLYRSIDTGGVGSGDLSTWWNRR